MALRWLQLLKTAATGTYENNCLSIAKGAAYSALLSFFPVITTFAALLVQTRADAVAHTLASFLYEVVPPGTEDVVRNLFVVHGQRPNALLAAAVVLAAWAASGAMTSLMEGFQATYHIPSGRSFVRERAMALLLVILSAAPAWGASALVVLSARTEHWAATWLGLIPSETEVAGWIQVAGQLLAFAIAFATFVLVTALVYYFAPNRKQTLRLVFPGAFLATLLWMPATAGFGWYVRHVSDYNVLYGSVGAGLALLVWMYVLAVIALFGCEFNAAWERAEAARQA
jgi:membrane protein